MKKNISDFFKVIVQSQTYLNLLYLLFAFPFGLFYFIFIVTGLSLGFGLAITLLGIPILFGVLLLLEIFAKFEIILAKSILNIEIPSTPEKQTIGFWNKVKAHLNDSFTWKSLAYLFLKFPLGIISFTALVTFLSISFSLISSPVLFYLSESGIIDKVCIGINGSCLNNYFYSIILSIVGIFVLLISLHLFNYIAKFSGLLTKGLLERSE